MAATTAGLGSPAQAAQSATPPNAMTGDQALARLMRGNARYVAGAPEHKDFSAGRVARAAAQHPFAAIVSCADSRLAPEYAFDQGLGDLFVVRVAGNFVNDDGLASLEYGAQFLGTPLILVLGHTHCGAVGAAIQVARDSASLPGHLPLLIDSITPAVRVAEATGAADLLTAATVENVRLNMARVTRDSPLLQALVQQGRLRVAGGVYDLASGRVNLI